MGEAFTQFPCMFLPFQHKSVGGNGTSFPKVEPEGRPLSLQGAPQPKTPKGRPSPWGGSSWDHQTVKCAPRWPAGQPPWQGRKNNAKQSEQTQSGVGGVGWGLAVVEGGEVRAGCSSPRPAQTEQVHAGA